jgi:CDP-diacylglycerol--glycerol-3-phosphate 3-phosphatidyltransferase
MKISIPNLITLGRLLLTLVVLLLLALFDAGSLESQRWLLLVCFWLCLAVAIGDALDGLVARWLHQETSFGRVIDPVVDKVMICGAFIFFASANFMHEGRSITSVQPWMVIVIIMRELLVSGIRAHAESSGMDFGAAWAGKFKMFIQSVTVCLILGQLGWKLEGLAPLRVVCIWLTVIVTALSIVAYVRRAHAFLLSRTALAGAAATPDAAESSAESGE